MGVADEERRTQEKALEARRIIRRRLRTGDDPRLIGEEIERQFDLDARTAYRWVVLTEEGFEISRRRIGMSGMVVMSLGFILVATGIVLEIAGIDTVSNPVVLGLATGIPIACAGFLTGIASRRLAR